MPKPNTPLTQTILSTCLSVLLWLTALNATAETQLPTIEVSQPTPTSQEILDTMPETFTGHSIVLQRKNFIHQAQSIAEVLSTQAGVQIRQTSGLGSYATVNIRGSASHQVMIYLDGIPLNSANGGGVNLSDIPLDIIEQIEIYPNHAPIQFASQYQGGVINLITRRDSPTPHTELTLMKGSFEAQKLSLYHQQHTQIKHHPLSWQFQGTLQSAKNNYPILNTNQTAFNPYDDRTEPRHNAQTEQKNLLTKLQYRLNHQETLKAQLLFNHHLNHLPNRLNTPSNQAYLETEQTHLKFSYQNNALFHSNWLGQTNLALIQTHLHYNDNLSQIGLGKQNNHYYTDSQQLQQYAENSYDLSPEWFITWQNNLLLKSERYHTRFQLDNPFLNNTTTDRERQTTQYAIALPTEHTSGWIITPSLTLQKFDDTPQNRQNSDTPIHEWNTTWQLGTLYPINTHHLIKARIGTAIRQPSFFEKYSDRGLIVGNPDLQKETSFQQEVGYRYQQSWKLSPLKNTLFELQLYQNTTDHIIIQSYDARGIGRSENLSNATIQGTETHLNLYFNTQTELDLNARYQQTQAHSSYSAYNGKQLPNLPKFTASFQLKQHYAHWQLYYQYHYESPVYIDRSNLLDMPEKNLHHLTLSYQQKKWRTDFQVKNLTDQQVTYFNGDPTPGRTFYLSLTLKL